MTVPQRVILPAIVIVVGLAGSAATAEDQGGGSPSGSQKDSGAATNSVGAGGLTGTGAVKDGARTDAGEGKRRADGPKPPSAPAAGTTR